MALSPTLYLLLLGETFISTTSLDRTTVYDFSKRRRLMLDAKTRTFEDYSLFDVIGFRVLELRNRENMSKSFA